MKNAIVGPAYPLRGGIANFNEALCRGFNKAGTSSEIYSFSLQYPAFLFPGKSQFESGPVPDDLKIHTIINSVNPISWAKTAKMIIGEKPDYLVLRYWLPFMAPSLGSIARLVRKKLNIPVIAITDNVLPHEKRPGDKAFTKFFLQSCDGFVVMSRSVLDDLRQFTSTANAIFIPHPIYDIFGETVSREEALNYLKLDPEFQYILFFGFIRKYKGLDLLIEAMGNPALREKKIKLIIAGEFYEDPSSYFNRIKELGLEEKVILKTEFIPQPEVKYYFCASSIVAQTYRSATQSGVTQIAYNFSRPMLVTNVGGLAEMVPHEKVGYVVEPDPKAIAAGLMDFFNNNREAEFSRNANLEKENFSWERMVNGIQGLVKQIKGS